MTRPSLFAILLACGLTLASHPHVYAQKKSMNIEQAEFGKTPDGETVNIYTLKNANGVVVKLIDYGAAIQSLRVPDKNGKPLEMQLGYDTLDKYLKFGSHFGSAVGRFANRIAGGKFTLDGKEYTLAKNNGPNHLHGGPTGFGKRIWKSQIVEAGRGPAVKFTYHSKDGEEGFPGNLDVSITYSLSDNDEFAMLYEAKTDKATIVNLTNHAYWNLAGADSGEVLDHTLMINADRVLDVDNTLIPTGKINSVKGTALDFTQPKPIGRDIAEVKKFRAANGYDHCFVLNKRPTREFAPQLAARATSPKSGITMEVSTTEPGVQLYTANHFDGSPATAGAPQHGAFCLETQHYPDSPNRPDFPTTTLKPGETYRQITVHKFSVEK
ncbi:MAG TPA: aldose epimerase family protein [Pirellulales bacterium]|nr:aldose epimerase family protein [Pirellulales bacterium]